MEAADSYGTVTMAWAGLWAGISSSLGHREKLLLFWPCEHSSVPASITLCKVILEELFFLLWWLLHLLLEMCKARS